MSNAELDYLRILRALMELPFQVGKNLLTDFLNGNYKNKSVIKNRLDELDNFGSLNWNKNRIYREIDRLTANGMIEIVTSNYNKFVKVLSLTIKGRNEITHPTLPSKKLSSKIEFVETKITNEDKIRFANMGGFLDKFNDEQKKAIISESLNLLCIAGAGSGKTTVLTKRIEFLVKYKGVDPSEILAITFTRKAREEMEKRLFELNVKGVLVHTFNSFCERILRQHGNVIYGRPIRVQGYRDKILAINMALVNMGTSMEDATNSYFTPQQRRFKNEAQMANSFMNDCFSVMDYFKVSEQKEYNFSKDVDMKNKYNADMIYRIIQYLKKHMITQGLRDYTDQLIDATNFLNNNPKDIPRFKHILIDEYQDVNKMQIYLLKILNPQNLFAVGDPRQSIFGWRGADINYILNFEKNYSNTEVIHLTKNYRSAREIVKFMNYSIAEMGLPDLEHHGEFKNTSIRILNFDNEDGEMAFVIRNIIDEDIPNGDIFILARTNRQLMELSKLMKTRGINHIVKTDEVRNPRDANNGDVILATIHAIKGLEARKVFLIGANEQNFPCKASDHPVIEMIKMNDYNKEEEERRLFYVAISRAKEILYITYSGKRPTYYINDEMRRIGMPGAVQHTTNASTNIINNYVVEELKSWRNTVSEEKGVAAFMILGNAVINEISRKMPKDANELACINGIGPTKLLEYGKNILEIVKEFADKDKPCVK